MSNPTERRAGDPPRDTTILYDALVHIASHMWSGQSCAKFAEWRLKEYRASAATPAESPRSCALLLQEYAQSHAVTAVERSALDRFAAWIDAGRTAQPTPAHRTNEDYAIEHGRYLATAAEDFLKAVNAYESALEDFENNDDPSRAEALNTAVDRAAEARGEDWRGLERAVYEFRKRADRVCPGAASQPPPTALPALNAALINILGRPNFSCARLADYLREKGHDIKRRSEDEQAAVIHWKLGLYLQHGEKWLQAADEYLRPSETKNSEGQS